MNYNITFDGSRCVQEELRIMATRDKYVITNE